SWDHRPDSAVTDSDTNGMYDREGAGIRHSLPVDGHFTASPRNRDWQNVAVSRRVHLSGAGDHGGERMAFWGGVSSAAGASGRMPPVPALFTRTRVIDFGLFPNADAGHSILGILSIACVCTFRRVRPARTVAHSSSLCFRAFSAYAFLPRLSACEYV